MADEWLLVQISDLDILLVNNHVDSDGTENTLKLGLNTTEAWNGWPGLSRDQIFKLKKIIYRQDEVRSRVGFIISKDSVNHHIHTQIVLRNGNFNAIEVDVNIEFGKIDYLEINFGATDTNDNIRGGFLLEKVKVI